jgi:mono/diheme cytochrome c family protein
VKARIGLSLGLLLLAASAPLARAPVSGAETFALDDFGAVNFGALNTVAVPWKLVAAALVLDDPQGGDVSQAHLKARLQTFGFLWPDRIDGADVPIMPNRDHPLGISVGEVTPGLPPVKVTVGNLGCASCHAGPAYAADGMPRPEIAWLGAPNTSLDLEAYTRAVTSALKSRTGDKVELLRAVRTLFPETDTWEMASLRWAVIPLARQRLAAVKEGGSPLPFVNGSPGLTNGVAALKLQGHAPSHGVEAGFTSIPDLADRSFRSALLYDGAYAPQGQPRWRPMEREDLTPAHRDRLAAITSFFTVPSMGQAPRAAHREIPTAKRAFMWLETRRPQTFPGLIDSDRAARGAVVYARACSSCHGSYSGPAERPRLTRFPNSHGTVGSDPARAAAFTTDLRRYASSGGYGEVMDARPTGQYAATLLSGIWATAPYMHNGSVPTLAQFLLLEPRSERFLVGGHRLDLEAVGIAGREHGGVRVYPEAYRPWSQPALFDTRTPGRSNRGHEAQIEGLTVAERWDLIEYLKGL